MNERIVYISNYTPNKYLDKDRNKRDRTRLSKFSGHNLFWILINARGLFTAMSYRIVVKMREPCKLLQLKLPSSIITVPHSLLEH